MEYYLVIIKDKREMKRSQQKVIRNKHVTVSDLQRVILSEKKPAP